MAYRVPFMVGIKKKFVNQTDLVFKEMIQFSVIGVCQYEDEMKKSRQKHTIAEIHSEMK